MPPSNCFRTGRRSLTQSSVKAVHGQDSKWMSGSVYHRNRRREARTRAEGPEKPVSCAPPERVRRAFALLTRTHHGCRRLGCNPDGDPEITISRVETIALPKASRSAQDAAVLTLCGRMERQPSQSHLNARATQGNAQLQSFYRRVA